MTVVNQRFLFQGTNQREAAIGLSESQIEYTMRQNRDHYMRVVRVWAFNEDWCGSTGCFIYKNNQGGLGINDKALERLDQVIFYANMYGIKIPRIKIPRISESRLCFDVLKESDCLLRD